MSVLVQLFNNGVRVEIQQEVVDRVVRPRLESLSQQVKVDACQIPLEGELQRLAKVLGDEANLALRSAV